MRKKSSTVTIESRPVLLMWLKEHTLIMTLALFCQRLAFSSKTITLLL